VQEVLEAVQIEGRVQEPRQTLRGSDPATPRVLVPNVWAAVQDSQGEAGAHCQYSRPADLPVLREGKGFHSSRREQSGEFDFLPDFFPYNKMRLYIPSRFSIHSVKEIQIVGAFNAKKEKNGYLNTRNQTRQGRIGTSYFMTILDVTSTILATSPFAKLVND
jgi:hypothetical protein